MNVTGAWRLDRGEHGQQGLTRALPETTVYLNPKSVNSTSLISFNNEDFKLQNHVLSLHRFNVSLYGKET